MRTFFAVVVGAAVLAGGAFIVAGTLDGPRIEIARPERFVGVSTPVDVVVEAPRGDVSALRVSFEQEGASTAIDMGGPETWVMDGPDRVRVTGQIGKDAVPGLKSGAGRIVVAASRPVVFGLRNVETVASRDVQVRLERPRVSVLSTHHYVNHGGAEMIVYRVSPEDVQSGVTVGDLDYPGYPASGLQIPGVTLPDSGIRVAFFALLHDQPLESPMRLYARDEAGNEATAAFDFRVFPKPFKNSRIELDDAFLERVVPAILEGTTEIAPGGSTIDKFVAINGELRRRNAETIARFAQQTSPDLLWGGVVFHPFTNNAVESAFADRRTYLYQGREVDRQVHLGFDLASYAQTPVPAANRGKVLFAGELGIYGNAVILDHGMGLQSLYAHLSSIDVATGATVDKDQPLGRSGMTGMAGGDHLHFTMLVHGRMVNPVEWWDAHWIEDRILRKVRDSGPPSLNLGDRSPHNDLGLVDRLSGRRSRAHPKP
jgi:murein DD-endopeptidase MepM/ murein hydrolase activator NlpD